MTRHDNKVFHSRPPRKVTTRLLLLGAWVAATMLLPSCGIVLVINTLLSGRSRRKCCTTSYQCHDTSYTGSVLPSDTSDTAAYVHTHASSQTHDA